MQEFYLFIKTILNNRLFNINYLNNITNLFTIFGVCFAVYAYLKWKKDYKFQKSHDYAREILKKIRILNLRIEGLREPRFGILKKFPEMIEKQYIREIENKIIFEFKKIQSEIIVGHGVLLKNNTLLNDFNKEIKNKIIDRIQLAISEYKFKKNPDLATNTIYKILFPSEFSDNFKKSSLTGNDIIDDDFNKIIEVSFNNIYSLIERELC